MILQFKIKNFRSIKEQLTISFVPSTKSKNDKAQTNIIEKGGYKALSSMVLYGRNASGKSNILYALNSFMQLIFQSQNFRFKETLEAYEPYIFDFESRNQPIEMEIDFVALDNILYKYSIKYNSTKIIYESLHFYPNKKLSELYIRDNDNFSFGDYYKGEKKNIIDNLLENQLFLSKAVTNKIKYLIDVFSYFAFQLRSTLIADKAKDLYKDLVAKEILDKSLLSKNIRMFIKAADTNISDIMINLNSLEATTYKNDDWYMINKDIMQFRYKIESQHNLFDKNQLIGKENLDFNNESAGTQKLLHISNFVLSILFNGGTLIIDELDSSLHPLLSKMLIKLFQSKKNNPNNAQIIFTTHDSSLLDNELFRRDQICFVEKNYEGGTEIYKLSDLKGVGKNVPYEKWYLSGRFAAIPVLSDFELDFGSENK
ncbi:MAG: ATPase core protein [Ignavibacteria bacterium]|nr:ATPase core protein [Ignavibacteria bacterium]